MNPLCIMLRSSSHDLGIAQVACAQRACYRGCPLCEPMAIFSIAQVACARRRATWVARDCSIKAQRNSRHTLRCSMSLQASCYWDATSHLETGQAQDARACSHRHVRNPQIARQASICKPCALHLYERTCRICVRGLGESLSRLGASTGVWK